MKKENVTSSKRSKRAPTPPPRRAARGSPRVSIKPPPIGRSQGAVLLAAVELTQDEKARRLGVLRELVSYWETGARVPTTAQRRLLYAAFQIQVTAWDEPAPAIRSAPPELLALGYRDMGEYLRGLVAALAHLATVSQGKDPKAFLRYTREAVAAFAQLGRYTGEMTVIPEEKLARMPSVRRTARRVLDVLRPWPDALRAVEEELRAADADG